MRAPFLVSTLESDVNDRYLVHALLRLAHARVQRPVWEPVKKGRSGLAPVRGGRRAIRCEERGGLDHQNSQQVPQTTQRGASDQTPYFPSHLAVVVEPVSDAEILTIARQCGVDIRTEGQVLGKIQELVPELQERFEEIWEFRSPAQGESYWISAASRLCVQKYPYLDCMMEELAALRKSATHNADAKFAARVPRRVLQYAKDREPGEVYGKLKREAERVVSSFLVAKVEKTAGGQEEEGKGYDLRQLSEFIGKKLTRQEALDVLFACPFDLGDEAEERRQKEEEERKKRAELARIQAEAEAREKAEREEEEARIKGRREREEREERKRREFEEAVKAEEEEKEKEEEEEEEEKKRKAEKTAEKSEETKKLNEEKIEDHKQDAVLTEEMKREETVPSVPEKAQEEEKKISEESGADKREDSGSSQEEEASEPDVDSGAEAEVEAKDKEEARIPDTLLLAQLPEKEEAKTDSAQNCEPKKLESAPGPESPAAPHPADPEISPAILQKPESLRESEVPLEILPSSIIKPVPMMHVPPVPISVPSTQPQESLPADRETEAKNPVSATSPRSATTAVDNHPKRTLSEAKLAGSSGVKSRVSLECLHIVLPEVVSATPVAPNLAVLSIKSEPKEEKKVDQPKIQPSMSQTKVHISPDLAPKLVRPSVPAASALPISGVSAHNSGAFSRVSSDSAASSPNSLPPLPAAVTDPEVEKEVQKKDTAVAQKIVQETVDTAQTGEPSAIMIKVPLPAASNAHLRDEGKQEEEMAKPSQSSTTIGNMPTLAGTVETKKPEGRKSPVAHKDRPADSHPRIQDKTCTGTTIRSPSPLLLEPPQKANETAPHLRENQQRSPPPLKLLGKRGMRVKAAQIRSKLHRLPGSPKSERTQTNAAKAGNSVTALADGRQAPPTIADFETALQGILTTFSTEQLTGPPENSDKYESVAAARNKQRFASWFFASPRGTSEDVNMDSEEKLRVEGNAAKKYDREEEAGVATVHAKMVKSVDALLSVQKGHMFYPSPVASVAVPKILAKRLSPIAVYTEIDRDPAHSAEVKAKDASPREGKGAEAKFVVDESTSSPTLTVRREENSTDDPIVLECHPADVGTGLDADENPRVLLLPQISPFRKLIALKDTRKKLKSLEAAATLYNSQQIGSNPALQRRPPIKLLFGSPSPLKSPLRPEGRVHLHKLGAEREAALGSFNELQFAYFSHYLNTVGDPERGLDTLRRFKGDGRISPGQIARMGKRLGATVRGDPDLMWIFHLQLAAPSPPQSEITAPEDTIGLRPGRHPGDVFFVYLLGLGRERKRHETRGLDEQGKRQYLEEKSWVSFCGPNGDTTSYYNFCTRAHMLGGRAESDADSSGGSICEDSGNAREEFGRAWRVMQNYKIAEYVAHKTRRSKDYVKRGCEEDIQARNRNRVAETEVRTALTLREYARYQSKEEGTWQDRTMTRFCSLPTIPKLKANRRAISLVRGGWQHPAGK